MTVRIVIGRKITAVTLVDAAKANIRNEKSKYHSFPFLVLLFAE